MANKIHGSSTSQNGDAAGEKNQILNCTFFRTRIALSGRFGGDPHEFSLLSFQENFHAFLTFFEDIWLCSCHQYFSMPIKVNFLQLIFNKLPGMK